MIEVVSPSRCTGCDRCVLACPMDVFDAVPGGVPVIARQDDCQTCFMCEVWCPVDALYVAPMAGPAPAGSEHRDEAAVAAGAGGGFGAYRAMVGWGPGRTPGSRVDANWRFTGRLRFGAGAPQVPVDDGRPDRSAGGATSAA